MTTAIDNNRASRDAILARVRKALRRKGSGAPELVAAEAYIAAHRQGPRPARPAAADLVTHFLQRVIDMSSTVERIDSPAAIPHAVARYLDALELPPALAAQKSHEGVC